MQKILFEIFAFQIRSYYLFWGASLLLFVLWTRRRAVKLYGMDEKDITSVLVWVYCAGILGSFIPGIVERFPLYLDGKIAFTQLFQGLYSAGGLLAGGLIGLWRLKKCGASADCFADAASIPLVVMLSIGRIGCLLEGCCTGIGALYPVPPRFWLHFPADPAGFWRFPSQPLESLTTFCIALFLAVLSKLLPEHIKNRGGLLFPFVLVSYGLYRLLSDPYRQLYADDLMNVNRYIWTAGIILGILWFLRTYMRISSASTNSSSKS